MATSSRPKILFVADGVSLAHPTRMAQLAGELNFENYEVHFATSNYYQSFVNLDRSRAQFHIIKSIDTADFNKRLFTVQLPYGFAELKTSFEEDCMLIDKVQPDLIIGDFRLSMAAAAQRTKTRLVTAIQSHWHPNYKRPTLTPFVKPVHLFGRSIAELLSPIVQPMIVRGWMNEIHRFQDWACVPRSRTLYEFYCEGDVVLFPDLAALYSDTLFPPKCEFIGPILWRGKEIPWPHDLPDLSQKKNLVYVSMGSTGDPQVIPSVVRALRNLQYEVLLSTAGRPHYEGLGNEVWQALFIPAEKALKLSKLFVCNGGTANTYSALSLGVPVLGITSNLDQCLHMDVLKKFHVAESLHCDQVTEKSVSKKVSLVFESQNAGSSLAGLQREITKSQNRRDINGIIERLLGIKKNIKYDKRFANVCK